MRSKFVTERTTTAVLGMFVRRYHLAIKRFFTYIKARRKQVIRHLYKSLFLAIAHRRRSYPTCVMESWLILLNYYFRAYVCKYYT